MLMESNAVGAIDFHEGDIVAEALPEALILDAIEPNALRARRRQPFKAELEDPVCVRYPSDEIGKSPGQRQDDDRCQAKLQQRHKMHLIKQERRDHNYRRRLENEGPVEVLRGE